MSNKSNNFGRAFEYCFAIILEKEVCKYRDVSFKENGAYLVVKKAWNSLDEVQQEIYRKSSRAIIKKIINLEPVLIKDNSTSVTFMFQEDSKGEIADVRDLIIYDGNGYEIGFSIKHNHFAAKHSRLSMNLDFSKKWYGVNCSNQYWEDIKPIFSFLNDEKKKGSLWKDILYKEDDVYVPLLKAFKKELERQIFINGTIVVEKLFKYLLGYNDFYKVISVDNKKLTLLQIFNFNKTLNLGLNSKNIEFEIPKIIDIPNEVIKLDFKENSKNTIEVHLSNDWQINFRIHNASSKVETSLKFDVQIKNTGNNITVYKEEWE